MNRWAWRNIRAHKARLALTVIAISIGVAFVAGTFIFTDTLQRAFDQLTRTQPYDVEVIAGGELAQDFRSQPELPGSLLVEIAQIPESAAVSANVQIRGIEVLDQSGTARSGFGPRLGVGWVSEDALRQLRLVDGQAPTEASHVALDVTNAERLSLQVGDTVEIATPQGRRQSTITGIFDFGISATFGGATITAFEMETARSLLNDPNNVSSILVQAATGTTADQLKDALQEVVPPQAQVITNEEAGDQLRETISNALGVFNIILLAFAGIALVVGSFIIANTFAMLIAQRARELALLRAIGASRVQITRAVLLEAALLGAVSSILGLLLGVGLAFGLRAALSAFGVEAPFGGLIVAPRTIAVALAVGILVTVLVAWLPAKRAGSLAPVAAMRDEIVIPARSLKLRLISGAMLIVASVVSAVLALRLAPEDSTSAARLAGVSAGTGLLGVIVLAPTIVRSVIGVIGAPFGFDPIGKLARENDQRNPRRTAATASALTIGLALITALATLGASLQVSVSETIDEVIGADLVITPSGFGTFSPEVAQIVGTNQAIETVASVRSVPALVGADLFAGTPGEVTILNGIEANALQSLLNIELVDGEFGDLAAGQVAIDQQTAEQFGLKVGDSTTLSFSIFPLPVEVKAIYESAIFITGFLTSIESLELAGVPPADTAVFASVKAGNSVSDAQLSVREELSDYPTVQIVNQAEFKDQIQGQVDQLLALVTLLILLAVVVAFVGVVNTLALGVIERTREIGLLRAIGMLRSQVRRMVVIESTLITLFGLILGILLGLVFGILLQRVLVDEGLQTLSVPLERIGLVSLVIAVSGLLAAIWPARRAARLNMLRAIATE